MQGMTLADSLQSITKKEFTTLHNSNSLLLIGAGNQVLEVLLSRLNDININWGNLGTQVSIASPEGKNNTVAVFNNGLDVFVLVIDDMQGSDYSKEYFNDTNRQHVTVYIKAVA